MADNNKKNEQVDPNCFFSRFLAAAADPVRRANAIKGFPERQAKREAEFERQAALRAPGPEFYNRRYDI